MKNITFNKKGIIFLFAGNLLIGISSIVTRLGVSIDISDFIKGLAVALMIGSLVMLKKK